MTKIEVIGNLCEDAKVLTINSFEYVSFRLGVTKKYKDRGGVDHEESCFFSALMSGNGGSLLQYLKKGTKIYVRGDLKSSVYERKDHSFAVNNEIFVNDLYLCG